MSNEEKDLKVDDDTDATTTTTLPTAGAERPIEAKTENIADAKSKKLDENGDDAKSEKEETSEKSTEIDTSENEERITVNLREDGKAYLVKDG